MKLTPLNAAAIEAEYELIVETVKQTDFNISKACAILQIDRKTFYNKIKDFKQYKKSDYNKSETEIA